MLKNLFNIFIIVSKLQKINAIIISFLTNWWSIDLITIIRKIERENKILIKAKHKIRLWRKGL